MGGLPYQLIAQVPTLLNLHIILNAFLHWVSHPCYSVPNKSSKIKIDPLQQKMWSIMVDRKDLSSLSRVCSKQDSLRRISKTLKRGLKNTPNGYLWIALEKMYSSMVARTKIICLNSKITLNLRVMDKKILNQPQSVRAIICKASRIVLVQINFWKEPIKK